MIKEIQKDDIKEKLKYIGLNLENIPKFLKENEEIIFKPMKMYDETSYKVYKYIDIKDIEILITPCDRMEELKTKYKKSSSISEYLEPNNDKNVENFITFIRMLENLDIVKLKDLEEEQKKLNDTIPYSVRYKDNYVWQIYYSDTQDKYFMLFPSNETRTESLFYIIKKKIEFNKTKKNEKIYVPICNEEYSSKFLKASEISDLENYLWLFTDNWPNVFEVIDKDGKSSLEIIGQTYVYDKIKSKYKINMQNKDEASEKYKLIKALFILQSYDEETYKFKTIINENGELEFCYNLRKIKYDNLLDFICSEVLKKQELLLDVIKKLKIDEEKLELLKQSVKKQNEEFLLKEKQIVTFLECKKTFFGRVKYFFKGKKQNKEQINKQEVTKQENKEKIENNSDKLQFELKDVYTIEDLLNICKLTDEKSIKLKNIQMDIKALENKKENLEKKIQNATQYINEIESHKKSIFDFWKFTRKDEVSLLTESEQKEEIKHSNIKRVFNYEEDLEDFGKIIDKNQREVFTKNECDAIFAVRSDITSFDIIQKDKILKKDDSIIQKSLNKFIKEYNDNIETIKEKDFDIFGNVVEDKTKIKVLKNTKHREIEKDKYKILNIKPQITLEDYKENIKNYYYLLKEAYGKIKSPIDISIYKIDNKQIKEEGFDIFNVNPEIEVKENIPNDNECNLIRIDIKQDMPIIFYSNIMFYDNLNETLPLGMDITTEVLINLSDYETKLISRKDFNINVEEENFGNTVKHIKVYEYSINIK